MEIKKLKKYADLIASGVRGCLPDAPCILFATDYGCTVQDAGCAGPGCQDWECGTGGDCPCGGFGTIDTCNPTTGLDEKGCSGLFEKDFNVIQE